MIIKKYEAETEMKAIMLAKDDLGKDAIVLNIKTVKPRGLQRLFRKPNVEITAAVDDSGKKDVKENVKENVKEKQVVDLGGVSKREDGPADNAIETRLNLLQEMLEKQFYENGKEKSETEIIQPEETWADKNKECLNVVRNQLIENEVDETFAGQILSEIEGTLKRETSVDNILTCVYQKLVLKLGESVRIDLHNKEKKFIFFIGPTGVGKTTTIAKVASCLKLKENAKVAMITSDTYRIAAVEQLRTYAGILGVPLSVVYTKEELEQEKEKYADYDIVLIDTAGRSHKNVEQKKDLEELVNTVDITQRQIFLVLSATTKNKDLVRITENYHIFKEYSVIFTKLDETTCVGNILNVRMSTGAPLSYMTWGQNVPDDFGSMDAQEIAKKLLGGSR